MAALSDRHNKTMRLFSTAVFIVSLLLCSNYPEYGHCKERPTKEDVETWAAKIDKDLMNINIIYDIVQTQYTTFNGHITKSVSGKDVIMTYDDVKEVDMVEEMSETLSEILSRKMEALNKSVDAAEKIARKYPWKSEIEISDVDYYNSKTNILSETKQMAYSERFGKEVNFNFSSVHIPVEIYEGSNDILNGLNWTSGLDAQFKENYEADPDILWQYFGSQSGFMRTYPATNWNNDGVDLYDVRRQSWYTQGSSSPKDMLILIDKSGSTYGQSLQLMKNAVKSILNTLGENDFVNVVEFSEVAKFVSKCFNHTAFVQANFRNKKQLERDVDRLEALGQADFSVAIKFAFEKFNEFARNETNDENNIGANCNKVIMLLTDGGTDNAEDVFHEYNWPNKTVRVFTYAVGPTPNPIHAIRWMACANRGYFSQIPAMGAIRSRVQEYIPVLSRPQVIKNKKSFEWGNIYEDHLGLGMMTTVTLPVYNRSSESSVQTILGVMGVDVTIAQLEAHTPFTKIGPNGYAFAINPNGYVVFHPNLKALGKFMKEPPNIDLLELEVDGDTPDLVKLRTEMIKEKTADMVLYSRYLSPCQRYVSYGQATYAFIPIKNTTFRLGISVPTYQKRYPKFDGDIKKFVWPYSSEFTVLIAPWDYHKDMSRMEDLDGTLNDIIKLLKIDDNPDNWNLQMLYHLYWDIKLMRLQEKAIKLMNRNKDVKSVFIMGNGGMTLVAPPQEADYFMKMRDLRKSSLHTRTLYSQSCVLMSDHIIDKRSNKTDGPYISISCPILIYQTNTHKQQLISDKPATAGLRVSHDHIMNTVHASIRNATDIINKKRVTQNIDFSGLMTCQDSSLVCYLIDDGGFLIATSRDDAKEQVGRFFGLVDPPVMNAMNGTVYGRIVQYDFQAACKIEEDTFSSGFRSFTIPTINLASEFLTAGFWTSKVSWVFSSFNFFSWLFSPTIEVMAENNEEDEKECVKSIQQYYFIKNTELTHQGGFECDNCTRNFTAVRFNSTNLLFIVADPVCEECDELYPPVGQAPREITPNEEEDIICQLAQNPRKRVQAYGCYHSDSNEDQTECGCACLQASRLSLYVIALLAVFQWISSHL